MITSLPESMVTLKNRAIVRNDVEGALRAAHKLKGAAACAGLEHVSGVAADLEAALKDAKESRTDPTHSHRRIADRLGEHVVTGDRRAGHAGRGRRGIARRSRPPPE